MSVKRSEAFALFYNLIAPNLGQNNVENLRLTKVDKEIKFEGVWDELGGRKFFQRQSVTKY